MKTLLLAVLLFPLAAFAGESCPEGFYFESCDGPQVGGSGPCTPGCYEIPGYVPPTGEVRQLCFPSGCAPVRFTWLGPFLIADSMLPSGYPVMGFTGPLLGGQGPNMPEQALLNLRWNAFQANRAARFQE
jgi:hypothetical protein